MVVKQLIYPSHQMPRTLAGWCVGVPISQPDLLDLRRDGQPQPHMGAAYSYVNRVVDAGVVEVTDDEQPQRYAASEIDLTVRTGPGYREYTTTPALIDVVGRPATNVDIDTCIDRHSVADPATVLTYAVAREHGEVTHQLTADDLGISPLAAEMILQALRPVVHEYHGIEEAGASFEELDSNDGSADDA